jgi:hypothetical protein
VKPNALTAAVEGISANATELEKGDQSHGDEEKTTPRGSQSKQQVRLDKCQFVVACSEWMVHLFNESRRPDDVGGRLLLAPVLHWRDNPAGAAEVAIAMALLSTSDKMAKFTTWQDRFPFLDSTNVGAVHVPLSSHAPIPSVSESARKLSAEEEKHAFESKTVCADDWNTAIGSPLPLCVLGVPRTRVSGSPDFTIKFTHKGKVVFLFVAATMEKLGGSKVKTVCSLS